MDPRFFGNNSNPYSLTGGMQFSKGPTLQGSVGGGSSTGFVYQASATQPVTPKIDLSVKATNDVGPHKPAENQVTANIEFKF